MPFYYYFDWSYLVLVVPALLFSLWASARVNSTFKKYSAMRNARGMTGAEAARAVLNANGVTDVRNFGAIAPSAECAGAHGLIMPVKNSAPVNAESMKSSAGALSVIPVSRVGSVRNTLKILQSEGLQIVAATEKSNTLLFEADLTKPTALVMGSEDVGISKEVLKMCDLQLAIPIVGSIESLNVSAAAAVMLFETARQRINNR